jgi:hypothetical protein
MTLSEFAKQLPADFTEQEFVDLMNQVIDLKSIVDLPTTERDALCQRRNKIRPLGGAKTGHFGSGRNARPEAAASQPRFPNSWRLTGRFGPSGPNQRGSAQAVSVDLRARL